MAIRIERAASLDQLTLTVQEQWNRLPFPSPMQSPDWLLRWWEVFGDTSRDRLCTLLAYDDERLVGVAPWYLRNKWPGGNCLRFLGDGEVCSDHSTVPIAVGYEEVVTQAIGDWLRSQAGQQWQTLRFDSVDEDNEVVARIVNLFASEGCEVHTRRTVGNWEFALPETWDAYLANVSKNHRKRCRRWVRNHFESGQLRVVRVLADDYQRGWGEVSRLNRERREIVGDRSAFLNDDFHRFHLAVLPELITNRKAELRELRAGDEVVATEYVLHHEKTIFCYQSGMATTDQRDGYGNLSIVALVRDAIESGFERIDFLRGDEGYKQHWGANRQGCVSYIVAAKTISANAQVACFRAADKMRAIRDSVGLSS